MAERDHIVAFNPSRDSNLNSVCIDLRVDINGALKYDIDVEAFRTLHRDKTYSFF